MAVDVEMDGDTRNTDMWRGRFTGACCWSVTWLKDFNLGRRKEE